VGMGSLEEVLIHVAGFLENSKREDPRLKGYALIGALAVSARGKPRATQDIDILLSSDLSYFKESLNQLASQLEGRCEIRKGDPDDPISYLARIYDRQEHAVVDFLKAKWKWEEEMIQAAEPVVYEGKIGIPVVRTEDLLVLKLRAGSPQDLLDAGELFKVVSVENLDKTRLSRMAKRARVDRALARLLRKSSHSF
jgi:Nucleotidyl transferase AbiEii toxin, Type IV TA system